ncbi:MAG TPA: hypothetical protein VEI96_04575 [Thermodesulfovibrionales bacterium]|nr:hypothetical protein [Thermodesulfovibrionales bacterium]
MSGHRCRGAVRMASLLVCVMPLSVAGGLLAQPEDETAEIIGKMRAVYANMEAYQMDTEVRVYREGRLKEVERFRYTFKKPDHIRIDMEAPHSGLVLIYPDNSGKVFMKPGGLVGFLKLHLSPDNALLMSPAGQRIDQTDVGSLINNMARSLTVGRRGEIKVSEHGEEVLIEVTSEDHFLAGVTTLYRFLIDKRLWIPVGVSEFTPDGIPKREILFRNLRTPADTSDRFFGTD